MGKKVCGCLCVAMSLLLLFSGAFAKTVDTTKVCSVGDYQVRVPMEWENAEMPINTAAGFTFTEGKQNCVLQIVVQDLGQDTAAVDPKTVFDALAPSFGLENYAMGTVREQEALVATKESEKGQMAIVAFLEGSYAVVVTGQFLQNGDMGRLKEIALSVAENTVKARK